MLIFYLIFVGWMFYSLVSVSSLVLRRVWWLYVTCRKICGFDRCGHWEFYVKYISGYWNLRHRKGIVLEVAEGLHKREESKVIHQVMLSWCPGNGGREDRPQSQVC